MFCASHSQDCRQTASTNSHNLNRSKPQVLKICICSQSSDEYEKYPLILSGEGKTTTDGIIMYTTLANMHSTLHVTVQFDMGYIVLMSHITTCLCKQSLMAEWLEHEMYCHDLEVISSKSSRIELGGHSTSIQVILELKISLQVD